MMTRITLILGVLATLATLLGGVQWALHEWRKWRQSRKQTWLGLLVACCLLPTGVEAATIAAATCNRADVQTALDSSELSADPDNTVTIPGGTCAWTTTVTKTLTKNLTVLGAGQGVTIIQDNAAGAQLFRVILTNGKTYRFSGWTMTGGTNVTANNNGAISIEGASTSVRIDHLTLTQLTGQIKPIVFYGCLYGLVDHVTIRSTWAGGPVNLIAAYNGLTCGGGSAGHYPFSLFDPFGGADCLYVEDSSFEEQVTGRTLVISAMNDTFFGGCMNVRHSTITNLFVQNHNMVDTARGGRHLEVSDTTFALAYGYTAANFAVWFESGTGVVHDVTQTGYTQTLHLLYDRSTGPEGTWGTCNGTSVYDGNTGTPPGYPCLDQPGRGHGILYTGVSPALPAAAAAQALAPIYAWNNTPNAVDSASAHVVLNRDYFLSAMPGYTAMAYPHPLQGGDVTPPAVPTGLTIFELGALLASLAWHGRQTLLGGVLLVASGVSTLTLALPQATAKATYHLKQASATLLLALLPKKGDR